MKKQSFNENWVYYQKGKENEKTKITLPHDAMIHRERIPKLKNGSYTGFFPSGDYYYVKQFFADETLAGQTVILEFEGVYMDSTVYLNGEKIGGCVYGYSNFYVELTDKLILNQENEIKVFVHCSQVPNARWYPGNGIYRPVNLYVGNKEHIKLDGVRIITKKLKPAVVELQIETTAVDADVETEIFYGEKIVARCSGTACEVEIPDAELWDAEHPNLYTAKVSLKREGNVLDETSEMFGIRSLAWNAQEGLLVNGKSVKLRGGCVHHDNGILGACEFERAAFRRIRIMKETGFNAIRSSHYPLSKQMLKACDELGMYVMDEAFDSWRENGGMYGYVLYFEEEWRNDLRKMLVKDRNHPCVIMYSIGNEITDTAKPEGVELTKIMTDFCHSIDPTRPVTVCPNVMMNMLNQKGINLSIGEGEPKKEDVTDPLLEEKDSKMGGSAMINIVVAAAPTIMKLMLKPKSAEKGVGGTFSNVDIAGYNYGHAVYEGHHKMNPNRIMVGSETMPPGIAKNWELVKKHPYVIGDFMWTGWDYLGEAGAGYIEYGKKSGGFTKPYPALTAYTGVIDLTGFRDSIGYLAGIVWGTYGKPYIGVRPVNLYKEKTIYSGYRHTDVVNSWTWPGCEGKTTEVQVFSQGSEIELYLNGKKIGRKPLKECTAKFKLTYHPGTLEAISYDSRGRELERERLKTAGEKTMLRIEPEQDTIRADGEDIAYMNIAITDQNGILNMSTEKRVSVKVEGEGTLQAVGSANPKATESYTGGYFTTYKGRMQAIVRSTKIAGDIRVICTAEGLEEQQIVIHTI